MAIRTSGFQVQAQPGMNYLPANQLVGNLGGILPAASQGAGFVSQLAQIQDEAQAAPLRRQLQQIQLAEAQSRLDQAPVNKQVQLAQLAHLQQPLERVLGTDLRRIQTPHDPNDTVAVDDNGQPTFAEGDTNYDITPIQRIEVTDPKTGLVSIQERALQPTSTSEQLGDRQDRAELAKLREESLAASRQSNRDLALERLNSPDWKRFGYGVDAGGKQVYLLVNSKTGQRQEVPTDLVPVPTGTDAMTAALNNLTGGGGAAASAAPKVNLAAPTAAPAAIIAPEDTPAQPADDETAALVDSLTQQFKIAAPVAPAYKSANDVKAAFKAGTLPRADAEKILREQFGLK